MDSLSSRGHGSLWIDQTLKSREHATGAVESDGTDLDNAIEVGRQPRGFEVERNKFRRIGEHVQVIEFEIRP